MLESQIEVSAILLTWNSARHIRRALRALARQREQISLEIVVVDNGSKDGSPELVRTIAPDAHVMVNPHNFGVARARNQGLKRVRGKYALLLDSDTEMTPGSLAGMVRFLDAHPVVGIVGPQLIDPTGSLQFSCRRFPSVPGKFLRQLPPRMRKTFSLAVEEEMHLLDRSTPQPVDYIIGACQLIRMATLGQIGLLDERMFYGPEDVDLCLRAWQRGWEVYYLPTSVVVHDEQRITRRGPGTITLKHAVALMYYFWKHRYLWRRPDPRKALSMKSPRGEI